MSGRRFNGLDPAELRRLARWYEGVADLYADARATATDKHKVQHLRGYERDARRRAAQLRAKVADR